MTKRWYIVNAFSGYEQKVADKIRQKAAKMGLDDKIEEVLVPTEEVVEVKKGKKKTKEQRFFPGYMLVHMEMDDDAWHLINSVPKVTGFLGPKGKPSPISKSEAERIKAQIQEGIERPRPSVTFEVGEMVKVIDGPFTSFTGTVEEVDEDNQRLKVSVAIFGRSTPVELNYTQVEKEED
jgi:transcriptional antiterminator NusG